MKMRRIDVSYIDQSVKYPTGCESVSTVMLLRFWGFDLSVDDFIDRYLDKQPFETVNGILYGADPRKAFAGSPYDPGSFGCYAPVICKALRRVVGDRFEVIDETGTALPELLSRYIDNGIPVIVWACINMRDPVRGPSWKITGTGEDFTWISNEHCMLLVGYDEDNYYFNDPYDNHGVIGYERSLTEDRHRAQHMQAVAVVSKES